jgi:NAD(P)H-flavin reductase
MSQPSETFAPARARAADPALGSETDPYLPQPAVVRRIDAEVPDTATYHLEFRETQKHEAYRFAAGQFNMLYIPGVGEVPISVSSAPYETGPIAHTIRAVGMVTRAVERLKAGDTLGLRGPYGAGWPIPACHGRDVLLVVGGLGLAPLRPVIRTLLARRGDFGRVTLLYGTRRPADLLYSREYESWREQGLELLITVDRAETDWHGNVGVVPVLLNRIDFDLQQTLLFTCGPEIMMRFVIIEALHRGLPADQIYLSIELNMQCAVGMCGRCQLGPWFVCKDGPVFAYPKIARFFHQEHF